MVLTDQGFNTEKFVPNPRHSSPLTLRMYEFVGKVIGIALRQQNYLPFELAPIVSGGDEPVDVCGSTNHSTHRNCVQVWKRLLGSKPTLDDLLAIDEYTHKHLAAIKDCEGITSQAEFEAEFCAESPLYFVVNGADGVYVHRAKLRQLVVDDSRGLGAAIAAAPNPLSRAVRISWSRTPTATSTWRRPWTTASTSSTAHVQPCGVAWWR